MPATRPLRFALIAGLALVVVGELVARLQGDRLCSDRPGVVYERDADLGWRHVRNLSGRVGTCDSESLPTVPVESDADGVLGPRRSRAKPPGTARILVLGGNALEALGVPDDMTVGRLLELYADERRGARLEVLNASTGGWALDNDLAFFRRDGVARQPDVVLVVLDPVNDVATVSPPYLVALGRRVPAKPYFTLVDGRVTPRPAAATDGMTPVETDEPAVPQLYRLAVGRPHHTGLPMGWANDRLPHGSIEDERSRSFELVRALLEALRDDVAASGARLVAVIAVLPRAFGEEATGLTERQQLTAIVDDLDIPLLDLTPVLAGIESRGLGLHVSSSVRLAGHGHARAASAIWGFLVDRQLLPPTIVPAVVTGSGRALPDLADVPHVVAAALWDARHGLIGRFAQAGLLAVCMVWLTAWLPAAGRDWVAAVLGLGMLAVLTSQEVVLAAGGLAIATYGAVEVLSGLRGAGALALLLVALVIGTSSFQPYHPPGAPWNVPIVIAAASGVALLRVVAYAVDRMRGAPRLRIHEYLAALLFFPTVPAGPIESPHAFVARRDAGAVAPSASTLAWSLGRLGLGLAEFTLASTFLLLRNSEVFESRGMAMGRLRLWGFVAEAGLMLTLLLAGWSHVAIALARLAGHEPPQNVRAPWASVDVADFWRRWHASFSRWLRDYVYVPIGGRRAVVRSVVVAFALAAAWYVWGFVKLLGYQAYAPRAWRGLLLCAGLNAGAVAALYALRLDRSPESVGPAARVWRAMLTLVFVCLAFLPLVMPLSATLRDLVGVYLRLFFVR